MRACRWPILALVIALLVALLAGACKPKPKAEGRRYPIEGRVISLDKAQKTVTLQHKDIPGYMKAMTMPFKLREQWALDHLAPGDYLNATLVVEEDEGFLEGVSINTDQHAADESSTSPVTLPTEGQLVPDFRFTDQEGRRTTLAHFRGQPLLLTFIYTRCPLPNFCPRMSSNFAEVARTLKQKDPSAFAHLQMLSITIDPEFDTPSVLKIYAQHYAGTIDPELQHWTFATGSQEEIRRAAQFFGLTWLTNNGQIVHDLRTAIVGPDGKVVALYGDNLWKPEDVAAKMAALQKK